MTQLTKQEQLEHVCDCDTKSALVCKENPDCRPSYCKMRRFDPPVFVKEIPLSSNLKSDPAEPTPWRLEHEGKVAKIVAANGVTIMSNPNYYPWCPNAVKSWELIVAAVNAYTSAPETSPSGWQPIHTAPKNGNFLVSLELCPELAWPAHRSDGGPIYSNAHGILNHYGHVRPVVSKYWRPMPPPPGSAQETCAHLEILTDHEGTCRKCGFRTAPSGMLPAQKAGDELGHRWEPSPTQPGKEWCPRCGCPKDSIYAGHKCNPRRDFDSSEPDDHG